MKKIFFYHLRAICCLLFLAALVSCAAHNDAPVVDGWKQNNAESSDYRVQKDDTVYSIAWAFGMDYRELAQLNNLQEPYNLQKGQTLRMSAANKTSTQPPAPAPIVEAEAIPQPSSPLPLAEVSPAPPADAQPVASEPAPAPAPPTEAAPLATTAPPAAAAATKASKKTPASKTKTLKTTTKWLWPTKGSVIRGFSAASGGNKGVDISGHLAQPITATATGKVVYTGASLPGYGNLIIIKHSENELSAYAFNKVIAVKEGELVKAGQTIAHMGKNDSGKAMLHFEIRKNGKPIDPMPYLNKK